MSVLGADSLRIFEALAVESNAPDLFLRFAAADRHLAGSETVLQLADHPNIAGIKCSGDLGQARRLIDVLKGSNFRVIVAQAPLIDVLLHAGIGEHVDGVYCIVPQLVRGIFNAAAQTDWELAAKRSRCKVCSDCCENTACLPRRQQY